MSGVLEVLLPMIGLTFLGVMAVRLEWIKATHYHGINDLVLKFLTPLYLFHVMSNQQLPEFFPWEVLVSFFGSSLSVFALSLWWNNQRAGIYYIRHSLLAFASSFGNLVAFGVPVILLTLGQEAMLTVSVVISVNTLIHLSAFLMTVEWQRQQDRSLWVKPLLIPFKSLSQVKNQPMLIAMGAGILVNQLPWEMPLALERMFSLIDQTVMPMSLMLVGFALMSTSNRRWSHTVSQVLGFKLILLPLLVWASASFLGLQGMVLHTLVLLAIVPAGVNTLNLAQQYQTAVADAAGIVFYSSMSSFVLLTLVVISIQQGWW